MDDCGCEYVPFPGDNVYTARLCALRGEPIPECPSKQAATDRRRHEAQAKADTADKAAARGGRGGARGGASAAAAAKAPRTLTPTTRPCGTTRPS